MVEKRFILFFSFLLLICPASCLLVPADGMGIDDTYDRSTVYGYVYDVKTGVPLSNYTISIQGEHFIGKQLRTNITGRYETNLSSGEYLLLVRTPSGNDLKMVEFEIREDERRRFDFLVDPKKPIKSRLYGHILDKNDEGLDGCLITLRRETPLTVNSTRSVDNGSYSLRIPAGTYTLTVKKGEDLLFNETITLGWAEVIEYNITTDYGKEEPIVTLQDIADFLEDHWIDILVLLGLLILVIFLYGVFIKAISHFRKKKYEFIKSDWFEGAESYFRRLMLLAVLVIMIRQIGQMSPFVQDNIWSWLQGAWIPIILIITVLYLSRIVLQANTMAWQYIRGKLKQREKVIIPEQILSLLEVISRYLLILISGLLILIFVLSIFGFHRNMIKGAGTFLKDHAGQIIFLAFLIIIGILAQRFLNIFFQEVTTKNRRMSPQMLEITKKGTSTLLYFVVGLVFVFTILSIVGLGDVGQTLILVVSMIIGLVVSFAATGSIGNLLSGIVLLALKPFDAGERVKIAGETIGDIQNLGMMFTTVRDLDGQLLEIPNNVVLSSTITNYSRSSAQEGGFAVVVDASLGYDINPKQIRTLMKRAALATQGIEKDPVPKVLITRFLDHAVEYRLRAYTKRSDTMFHIRTAVMENMLEAFNEAGYEILSPMYHVKREGTVPSKEDLLSRNLIHRVEKEEAPETLSMFDSLEGASSQPASSPQQGT